MITVIKHWPWLLLERKTVRIQTMTLTKGQLKQAQLAIARIIQILEAPAGREAELQACRDVLTKLSKPQ